LTATVDLPTPPLQEVTAIICFTSFNPLILGESPWASGLLSSVDFSYGAIATVTLVAHSSYFSKWEVNITFSLRKSLVKLILTVTSSFLKVIEWMSFDLVIGVPFSSFTAYSASCTRAVLS
jgi:hypothetical protein